VFAGVIGKNMEKRDRNAQRNKPKEEKKNNNRKTVEGVAS